MQNSGNVTAFVPMHEVVAGALPIENWITRVPLKEVGLWYFLLPRGASPASAIRMAAQLRGRGLNTEIGELPTSPTALTALLREQAGDGLGLYLDPNICWVAPDALSRLLNFQAKNPEYLFIHPAVANTVPSLFMWQIMGCLPVMKIPKWEIDQYCHHTALTEAPLDVGLIIHELFLTAIRTGTREKWYFNRWIANASMPVVSEAFLWHNPTWRQAHANTSGGGQSSLSALLSASSLAVGMPCIIHGEAQMALFANPQQKLLFIQTEVLRNYRELYS